MNPPRNAPPRLYHVAPTELAAWSDWHVLEDFLHTWDGIVQRAVSLGFDHVLCGPVWRAAPESSFLIDDPYALAQDGMDMADVLTGLSQSCRRSGVRLWLDLSLAHALASGRLANEHPEWYASHAQPDAPLDPRRDPRARNVAALARHEGRAAAGVLEFWQDYLLFLANAGVEGFRVHLPQYLRADEWQGLIHATRAAHPECSFTAWTPGLTSGEVAALAGSGFAAVYSSLAWWNFRDDWFVAEHDRLSAIGHVIAPLTPPDAPHPRQVSKAELLRLMQSAAELGNGVLLPRQTDIAHQHDDALAAAIAQVNMTIARQAHTPHRLRQLAGMTTPFTAILREESIAAEAAAAAAALIVINPSPDAPAPLDWELIRSRTGAGVPDTAVAHVAALEPAAVLALALCPEPPVQTLVPRTRDPAQAKRLKAAMRSPRIVIQDIQPSLATHSHLIKCCVGDSVHVGANVFIDGHDVLAVRLLWRALDEEHWSVVEMRGQGNDAWTASFTPQRVGRHEFAVEAWRDVFGTYRSELQKKHQAGLDVSLEIQEGRELTAAAGLATSLAGDVQALLSENTLQAMKRADLREFCTRHAAQALNVERHGAACASWYEMFPRSQSGDPQRHGTFRDVIARLPYVRDMGFDVLYFPPIHPIGRRNRKGRNNSLVANEDDPGSPYATGAAEGGHDALHPELGTLEDFRELLQQSAAHGLEVAMDFAIQCSPDHPWLAQHPDWFAWRADGSLRYAENPPKKYEDIVNVDFYGRSPGQMPGAGAGTPALWLALRDVVLFWANEGVRTFRVDNPHTKPLPFWEWLIAEVQARYPDTIFLSEAFTRPNMMYHLAKIGFSQSYTYFTWRHTRRELTQYLEEIGNSPVADFFRPHFFVNTPDINPYFLQTSGRPGFLIRAALATTLSGLWGMYNGFELCEGTPVLGKEEYLDSEKYEIRAWDWDRPGNIRAEIRQLNRIRRSNPALHSHRGIEFLPSSNEQVLFYSKSTPQRDNVLLIAVSLDPHSAQQTDVELPLWRFGLPDDGELRMEDLLHESRYTWRGKYQVLHLHPGAPYGVWRVSAQA